MNETIEDREEIAAAEERVKKATEFLKKIDDQLETLNTTDIINLFKDYLDIKKEDREDASDDEVVAQYSRDIKSVLSSDQVTVLIRKSQNQRFITEEITQDQLVKIAKIANTELNLMEDIELIIKYIKFVKTAEGENLENQDINAKAFKEREINPALILLFEIAIQNRKDELSKNT